MKKASTPKKIKDTRLNIRIDGELKQQIQDTADSEGRTLANFVLRALQEKLDQVNKEKPDHSTE